MNGIEFTYHECILNLKTDVWKFAVNDSVMQSWRIEYVQCLRKKREKKGMPNDCFAFLQFGIALLIAFKFST